MEKTHLLKGTDHAVTHLWINPDGAVITGLWVDDTLKTWSLHSYRSAELKSSDNTMFRKKQNYKPLEHYESEYLQNSKIKPKTSFNFNRLKENWKNFIYSLR